MLHLQVTDSGGWTKAYPPISKEMAFVGSGPHDDVRLDASRSTTPVQSRHVQLIELKMPTVTGKSQYKLINTSDADVMVITTAPHTEQAVPALGWATLLVGDQLRIGEYTLTILDGESPSPMPNGASGHPAAGLANNALPAVTSQVIGLELRLPYAVLSPQAALVGGIVVRNKGNRNAAQFQIDVSLDGVRDEVCPPLPGIVLFPGVTQEIPLSLKHPCGPVLLAGSRLLVVQVTAPSAYAGELAQETRAIQVMPCYRHRLQMQGGKPVEKRGIKQGEK